MIKRPALITVGLSLLLSHTATSDDAFERFLGAVVYLHQDSVETVTTTDGNVLEVGTRSPGDKDFRPSMLVRSGSGFLVSRADRVFLVTAKHVSAFLTPDSECVLRASLGTPWRLSLRELTAWQAALHWQSKPDADVAAVELRPKPDLLKELRTRAIPREMLTPDTPGREITLTVFGFPLRLGTGPHFSPLVRDSRSTGGLLTLQGGETLLILQDPGVGGFSGGPVVDTGQVITGAGYIGMRGPGLRVVGVMSRTLSDDTGGKFAGVVPISEVVSLLESF